MGIDQIRMNQTKALPPASQFNWSQMESNVVKAGHNLTGRGHPSGLSGFINQLVVGASSTNGVGWRRIVAWKWLRVHSNDNHDFIQPIRFQLRSHTNDAAAPLSSEFVPQRKLQGAR